MLSLEMRIAFYCGILAFACQDLTAFGDIFVGVGVLLPYVPLLAIPAFQLRSWSLASRAFLLGPALVLVQTLLGLLFVIDSRIATSIAIFVPGGWNATSPGHPMEFLLLHLAIFLAFTGGFLSPFYRATKLGGLGYLPRLIGAGLALEAVLAVEIHFTTLGWTTLDLSDDADRLRWAVASLTWLLSCGLFCACVFGTPPAAKKDAT